LIPNPILKVLSALTRSRVHYLLMGGQACVFYGAAEFSRDTDVAVPAAPENLDRLAAALEELQAQCIAVPPFTLEYLVRGHAVHFRCHHAEAQGMRIDVMSKMRGVAPFEELWQRRTTLADASGVLIEMMSLADLVQAKKTQRDKDWPMLRRLVESHVIQYAGNPTPEQVRFWLLECRTPTVLRQLAAQYPEEARALSAQRALLASAASGDDRELVEALDRELNAEREADRAYWAPLRAELEELRHRRRSADPQP